MKIDDNGRSSLESLRDVLSIKINELPSVTANELENLKTEFESIGLVPKSTYLFLRGHNIYDDIVKPILNRVADILKKEQLELYSSTAKHSTDAKNKRVQYKKHVFTSKKDEMTVVERYFASHKYYDKCPFSTIILTDLDNFKNSK